MNSTFELVGFTVCFMLFYAVVTSFIGIVIASLFDEWKRVFPWAAWAAGSVMFFITALMLHVA